MTGEFKKDCPICKDGTQSVGMSPIKTNNERAVVFVCTKKKCSHTFKADGGAFVKDANALATSFKMGHARSTLDKVLLGEKVNPATRNLLMANIVEYGLTMWQDGLKAGLVINATREDENTVPN